MADILLSVNFTNGKENILSISTDGACNMTGQYQGFVNILENALVDMLMQVWCGDHQIELVM